MKLLTQEIRKSIPKLYAQDGKGQDAVIHAKFFDPCGSWTWFATEGEPLLDDDGNEIDFKFFGMVHGHEKELGYWLLSELQEYSGPLGIGIERDLHFGRKTLGDIK
tara:strand:+ start:38313 stop:38630 length:318 start_codon:yes stop_codon:yes gene_type:complete